MSRGRQPARAAYMREYGKRYYQKHKAEFQEYTEKQYRIRRDIIAQFKNQPCADCGHSFPVCAMDFDHVRGEKSFGIGGVGIMCSIPKLLAEIAKCDVVCACCHRVRTWYNQRRRGIEERKALEKAQD